MTKETEDIKFLIPFNETLEGGWGATGTTSGLLETEW